MKLGISLTELAQKIEENEAQKKDLVSDTRELRLASDGDTLAINGHAEVKLNEIAHRQVADRLGIPAKYYDRMKAEQPQLLADNVNTWFQKKPERRLIRALGTTGRAFLSDRYQRIDDGPVMRTALPVFAEHPGLKIVSCEITERKLYLKAVYPKVQGEIKVGDVVQTGVCLTNSEVGLGAYSVVPLIERLICKNGMIVNDHRLRVQHVGRRIEGDDNVNELFADDTKEQDDKTLALKVRDLIKHFLSEEFLAGQIVKFRGAAENMIEGHPVKAVEVLSKRLGFNEEESGGILRYLTTGGDLSQWGLANAVTRLSQDISSYDRATDLEVAGGKIIDLPANDWKSIAKAA